MNSAFVDDLLQAHYFLNSYISLGASDVIQYDDILKQNDVLAPVDHPNPRHLWVTGTGLVHFGSTPPLVIFL